jgi:hypothetical protein
LAVLQKVHMTWAAVRDSTNLGYELADVCRCLEELKTSDFRHSGRYDSPLWYDVYRIRFTSATQHLDDLYIKLSLSQGCLVLHLFSFHPARAI